MKKRSILMGFAVLLHTPAMAFESLIELAAEGTAFVQQSDTSPVNEKIALSLKPKFTHQFESSGIYFTFEPFFRWDQRDDQRSHADIGELKVLKAFDQWELEVGASKVFWGVAESNHLVDIINQTDTLEGIDGEDKLGQPMLRLSRIFSQTSLDAYILPGFRERAFVGPEGRFALPFEVDADQAQFESADGKDKVDYALRYSGYAGQADYGVSWFKGTARAPVFIPSAMPGTLLPYYQQVERFGLDVQYTVEAWLWKLEALRQFADAGDHSAAVGGLEYTFFNLGGGAFDLGLLAEYNYDTRDDPQTVLLQNDVFLASRFAYTDAASSAILAGVFLDRDDDSQIFRIEASRRVFNDATVSLEAQVFSSIAPGNASYAYRQNDFVRLEMAWYF